MTQTALNDLLPHGYIDAHHHVWAPESRGHEIGYGWLRDIGAMKPFGDPTPIQRDYLMAEYLAETPMPPRASVHVQTDGALPDPVAETRFVQQEVDRAGHAVKIVALADLSADTLPETLSAHAMSRDFCGVRQIVARLEDRPDLTFAPRDYLRDPKWVSGLKLLEDRGLTFDLQMYPEQAEAALEALSATPALTVVIDHALCPYFGTADPSDPGAFHRLDTIDVASLDEPDAHEQNEGPLFATQANYDLWHNAVQMMAARPNTYIKLSGWGMYQPDWATDGIAPVGTYVLDLLVEFGADRVMWGSNYPVEKLVTPYDAALQNTAEYVWKQYREEVFLKASSTAYGIKLK